MKKEFYSNGKLLITGEYLVLDGAKGFALPTKFGQYLIVEQGKDQQINWRSYDADGNVWLEEVLLFEDLKTINTLKKPESFKNTLIEILQVANSLNPTILEHSEGFNIKTELTFPRNWGLGTSSTLINNIAQWFEIDAFVLLNSSFGGSGYDIACAQNDSPILYHLVNNIPIVEKVVFEPKFTENLYFVYLDKKQSSKTAIASYFDTKNENLAQSIKEINILTEKVVGAKTISEFAIALEEHESQMSSILELKTVKESLFSDFKGVLKSLGAWGGDFILAVANENPSHYFEEKGYQTIIPYKEMIL